MSLIKVRVEWNGSNKVLNLDRTKANLYERLMMTLNMSIDEDIMLFDGEKRVNDEVSLVASMEACISKGLPHLQLQAKPDDGTSAPAQLPEITSTLQVKKEEIVNVKCVSCGKDLNGKKFCMNCGAKAPEPKPQQQEIKKEDNSNKCVSCGKDLNGKKFCANCGAKALEPKPQQEIKKQEDNSDKCLDCGNKLNGKKFCMNCGAKAGEKKQENQIQNQNKKQEET